MLGELIFYTLFDRRDAFSVNTTIGGLAKDDGSFD
jgi:hypothetical protein